MIARSRSRRNLCSKWSNVSRIKRRFTRNTHLWYGKKRQLMTYPVFLLTVLQRSFWQFARLWWRHRHLLIWPSPRTASLQFAVTSTVKRKSVKIYRRTLFTDFFFEGQFYDFINIFETNGYPDENHSYLFNGDFVDRGSFSVEVILTLFAYKWLYPERLYLARGNHETDNMNKVYGFEGEVKAKFSEMMFKVSKKEGISWRK